MNQETMNKIIEIGTQYGVKIVGALALSAASVWASRFVNRMCVTALQKAKIDLTLSRFVGNLIRWVILAVSFVSILGIFGVETTSFAAAIAASGLAVGLAFQGTLSNFAAGVVLLITRPFRTGHVITVAGHTGTVFEIDFFTTKLDTVDNRRIVIPNSSVFGATIENMTEHNIRRVDLAVGTSYGSNIDDTRQSLKDAVGTVPGVLVDPAAAIVMVNLGTSSIDWAVRAWARTEDYWDVREQLLVAIKKNLDTSRISIPFPQLDVNLSKKATEKSPQPAH